MNSLELSPSKDFARMVALMGLKVGKVPIYEVDDESVPNSRSLLVASDDLPSVEEAPDELKWIIKQMREVEPQEQLGLLDLLGLYKSDPSGVERYDLLIQLVALKRAWPVEALKRIVHWHELAHAANHLGLDEEGSIWKGFAFESSDVKEYFAQIYTFKMLVETGDDEALKVMEEFTPRQPRCYQTYLPDKAKAVEQINQALLEARRRAPLGLPYFEEAFSSSWGIKFEGTWQDVVMHFMTPGRSSVGDGSRFQHGSDFHVSGLKIRIKSHEYQSGKRDLEPKVAHRLFEIATEYLAKGAAREVPKGSRVECWRGNNRREFFLGNESSAPFWRELCDAVSIQLPVFAKLLREQPK